MEDGAYKTGHWPPPVMTLLGKVGRDLPVGEHSFPFLELGVPDEEDVPAADVTMQYRNLHCLTMGYVICQWVLLKEGRGRETHR